MKPEDLTAILEIGLRAISTCNNQPWRFRTNGEALDIFMLRTKNFFLKLEGNTWIELGTMLENISVGAASKGFSMEYQLFERCGLDEPAATLRFIPSPGLSADIGPVLRRCTNRGPYSENPLSHAVKENIMKACDVPNIKIQILTGTKKETCAEILTNLESVRLGNRLLVEEVLPYIRIDQQEIETCRDRLDVKTMEFEPTAVNLLQFSKKHPHTFWISHSLLGILLGLIKKQQMKFKKTLTQSGALIAFMIKKRDQESYVDLGRITQRILNSLTAQNVQTYTIVSGLYLLDLLKENLEVYTPQEQILLLRYQYDLQSFFNFTDWRIALFIRAGYADPPKIRSLRKRAQDVMLDQKGDPLSQTVNT